MEETGGSTLSAPAESRDIYFACQHCSAPFVVDVAAAGITLKCQKCGEPTTVPQPDSAKTAEADSADPSKVSELKRHLKENESQCTEVTGYINQLNIQLHRWQLRLRTLKERQQKLQDELASLSGQKGS
jgi:hypothetical protein